MRVQFYNQDRKPVNGPTVTKHPEGTETVTVWVLEEKTVLEQSTKLTLLGFNMPMPPGSHLWGAYGGSFNANAGAYTHGTHTGFGNMPFGMASGAAFNMPHYHHHLHPHPSTFGIPPAPVFTLPPAFGAPTLGPGPFGAALFNSPSVTGSNAAFGAFVCSYV